MVSLLKNNLTEENAMNLPLENGQSANVKYKWRSVSAVRDFPPGCGPNAARVDVSPRRTTETERVRIEVVADGSVDRSKMVDGATGFFPTFYDNPPECGSGVPLTNSAPQETTHTETKKGPVKTELETLVPKLETREMIHGVTRVLPAVRDFPLGCGPDVPKDNVNPQDTSEKETGPVTTALLEGSVAKLETSEMIHGVTKVLPAVRDFPLGCEPDVPKNNVNPQDTTETETEKETGPVTTVLLEGSVAKLETSETLVGLTGFLETDLHHLENSLPEIESDLLKETNNDDMEMVMEMVRELTQVETQTLERQESFDREVHPLVMEKEPQGAIVTELTSDKLQNLKVRSRMDNLCGQELESVLKIKSKPDVVVPLDSERSIQLPVNDVNIPVKISSRNKITPRKVSVTRDFPPFCGRNAPVPTDEDRVRINSGKKSLIVIKKNDTECGVSREALKDVPGSSNNNGGLINTACNKTVVVSQKESNRQKMSENVADQGGDSGRVIVQALMAASCDPSSLGGRPFSTSKEIIAYQQDGSPNRKMSGDELDLGGGLDTAPSGSLVTGEWTLTSPDNLSRSKAKKRNFSGKEKSGYGSEMKTSKKKLSSKKSKKLPSVQKNRYEDLYDSVMREEGDFVAEHGEQIEDSSASRAPHEFEVSLPPFGPNTSNHDMRNRVREALRLFQAVCRKILQGEEAKSRGGKQLKSKEKIKRIDLTAAKFVKEKGKEVNTDKQIVGAVPGVEVGDEFQYRVELAIVGIHRLYQAGIDYIKYDGNNIVAVSIVASGGYADELDNSDVLVYSGQGGLSGKDKQPEDQKLERGNLALKNSIAAKNLVRVIRGSKETKASESADARAKTVMTYVYDGLYTVERFWQEEGVYGKLVFKFELRRLPGQPELAWKEVKKSNKSRTREGLCVNDISEGKEIMPICAVNTVDDDKPPPFTYVTRMIYPDSCNLILPKGCDCKGRCLDAKRCLCAAKNGEIPYNFNGAIVEVKPLVYECGPSCKCPPSCYNRVSQHGIKFQLEIFKTESRGWGVRSLNSITAGSFICEYTGELLEDREAEKRTGNDEYLFDIGKNYSDCSHRPNAESNTSNVTEDGGFTIDAAQCGNVGRFINHSCSPNLYAQNVLYDHENKRMPHIMLFAAENIPPLKELTYHYNYPIDQVFDSNGEIKMKMCYCGSSECTGRMY